MDPRLGIVEERLKGIRRLIAVSGGKGGIGKSSIASALALILSQRGHRVGLLDLDFCGPSAHVILGIEGKYPEEEKGIIPPEAHGIRFMSITYYAGDNPSPLRGIDVSNAMIELLAITRWGDLDFLIIDMPPGIGDATLDLVRLVGKASFLIITTGSRVALETVKKMLVMLKELNAPIVGVIQNMKFPGSPGVESEIEALGLPFLGEIGFDAGFEDAIGDVDRLSRTGLVRDLRGIVLRAPELRSAR